MKKKIKKQESIKKVIFKKKEKVGKKIQKKEGGMHPGLLL